MKKNNIIKAKTVMRKTFLLAFLIFMCLQSNAQAQSTVSGVVTSAADDFPIIGATINKVGTKIFATTDFDGVYTIKAKKGDILKFTYLGMKSQTITISGTKLNVVLEQEASQLEDVVVIGYGAVQKKELTGAVSQIKSEEIDNFVTADLASALQGQIAGLNVNAVSGEPGETSSILIRGISSLTGTNSPLYVVDGIPYDEDPNINPNEVQTIDVLKDAASAAIYGTRGAGGVILITTKQGKENTNTVSFDGSFGIQNLSNNNFTETLNASEQLFADNVSGINSGTANTPYSLLYNTDIKDFAINENALIQKYNLRFSGGTKGVTYSLLGGYFSQEGIIGAARLDRYSLRGNVRIKKNKWSFNNGFGLTIDNNDTTGSGLIRNALSYLPFFPDIETVVDYPVNGDARNRVQALLGSLNNVGKRDRYRVDANTQINYQITPALSLTTLLGASFTYLFQTRVSVPFSLVDPFASDVTDSGRVEVRGSVLEAVRRSFNLNWNGGLNYKKKFGKHSFTGTGLVSAERLKVVDFAVFAAGLLPNGLTGLSNTNDPAIVSSAFSVPRNIPGNFVSPDSEITRIGTIVRLLYDYDKRYLINLSTRYDGSSQFSKNKRWNAFPSASFAWNIAQEEFWSPIKHVVNNLKYRISYGTTGNDRFTPYASEPLLVTGLNNVQGTPARLLPGNSQENLSSTELQWETTKQFNLGTDISFFKNKLTFTTDYYVTKKDDLLLNVVNPPSSGVGTNGLTVINVGNMTNRGLEISGTYRGKYKDFSWIAKANYSKNKNIVTNLAGDTEQVPLRGTQLVSGDPQPITYLIKGEAAGSFYVHRTDGIINDEDELAEYINQTGEITSKLGDLKIVDVNGDGVINDDDKEVRGSGLADFELGLNLNLKYKNISLSSNWSGSFGNEVFNGSRATAFSHGRHRDLLYQWSPQNPNAIIPVYRGISRSHGNYATDTDRLLEDGSFVRLTNLTLSYALPKKILSSLGLSSGNIFITGQNLFTLTNYSGFNPAVGGNNINRRGLDSSVYPITTTHSIGFKLKF